MKTKLHALWEKFKSHCHKWSLKPILAVTLITSFLLDIIASVYLLQWIQSKYVIENILMNFLRFQKLSVTDVEPYFVKELVTTMERTVEVILIGFLVVNIVFYLYCYFRKRWAAQYVKVYLLTAALLGLTFAFDDSSMGASWLMANLLSVVIYFVLAGIIYARWEELGETGFKFSSPGRS